MSDLGLSQSKIPNTLIPQSFVHLKFPIAAPKAESSSTSINIDTVLIDFVDMVFYYLNQVASFAQYVNHDSITGFVIIQVPKSQIVDALRIWIA